MTALQEQTQITSKPGDVPWALHKRKYQSIAGVDVESRAVLNGWVRRACL